MQLADPPPSPSPTEPVAAPSRRAVQKLVALGQLDEERRTGVRYKKKDTSVTFWVERIFFCHTYDTSMTIIVTKHGIIVDVVGSYFYDKKS